MAGFLGATIARSLALFGPSPLHKRPKTEDATLERPEAPPSREESSPHHDQNMTNARHAEEEEEATHAIVRILVYPVKSMGAWSVAASEVDACGLRHDRRFAVVDATRDCALVTQREARRLAAMRPRIDGATLVIDDDLRVPLRDDAPEDLVTVRPKPSLEWGAAAPRARDCGDAAARWLSARLAPKKTTTDPVSATTTTRNALYQYRLVRFADERRAATQAPFGACYAASDRVAFHDSSPLLVAATASAVVLPAGVAVDRFRANLVVETTAPFDEDFWADLRLEPTGLALRVAKPCHRCAVTTIPQQDDDDDDHQKGAARTTSTRRSAFFEPLTSLRRFRRVADGADAAYGEAPCFCVNLAFRGDPPAAARVAVGDVLRVVTRRRHSWLAAPWEDPEQRS